MVVDFSNIDVKEKPVLILKNTSGTPLGTLGSAYGVKADIKYNEVSTLEFNLPAYIGKTETPKYNSVIGMRIIDLQGIGQFVLMNPKETGDGTKTIKACKGYSLEYEFTFKKITLENGTYNFWNPAAPGGTILGIILELMPSWSVGTVDSSLVGKYRTYEVSDENLYNFIKNTLQQSYNCIFDFDTYNRTINVRDVSSSVSTEPIFISCDNLAKEIEVEEDTENIITRLDVNGADGVDIRDVNPSGTNKIINLDYFMTTDNFEQSLINKYNSWKSQYSSYQLQYYNLSIEYSIQVMRKTAESAKLVDLEGELTSLENQQAVIIRAIAETLSQQSELTSINASISAKQSEINAQKSLISSISAGMETILDSMRTINQRHIQKLSNDCQQVIYAGIDVTLSDNLEHHFDLQIEDQLNLLTLTSLVASGEQAIPYHASNELCVFYSPEDITKIVEAATAFKIYHTSYFNSLKNWVLSLDTIAEVGAVSYGDAIPQEYCSDILIALMQSQEN